MRTAPGLAAIRLPQIMRSGFAVVLIVCLASLARAQQPTMPTAFGSGRQSGESAADFQLRQMWEPKIKAEWEAIKNKDKKAYGELLADDYQGVENDGNGERTKLQAINELSENNVANYTLWGFKPILLGSDAALVIYEVTLQFPPKSVLRFRRVYISELWVKRAGQWQELHYQETHVK